MIFQKVVVQVHPLKQAELAFGPAQVLSTSASNRSLADLCIFDDDTEIKDDEKG